MGGNGSMNGKVILITGATDGIGRAAAEALAGAGAQVVIVGRNPEKAARTAQAICEKTGHTVDVLLADLSVQEQVRALAASFLARYDRLDVLINNAGAWLLNRQESTDGIEMTLAVNYLATFLLTHLLLDRLATSAPARVINVSSIAHRVYRMDLNDLHHNAYDGFRAYARSKLALLYFTYELARRMNGLGVTVNALHPGLVATHIGNSSSGLLQLFFRLFPLVALTPEQGAQTTLYLATAPELEGVSGQYFERRRAVRSSKASYDLEMARRVWQVGLQLTGLQERV